MDDGNVDQMVNDVQSDIKQNCVDNANTIQPPASDNCVGKKTSFEITSITEPNNDDNDEDSPDTDSHVHEPRTVENRHEAELQNYADNMVVYNTSNDLGSSAPVIPTSSQYGLAIVDNSDSCHSLGSLKNEEMHCVDANSQKSECDMNGLQNKNRNERFKVVKIESTEPFKRGRWVCMDFLDHSMNQQQTGNNKIIMVNGDNKAYSQANDSETTEPLDNGHHEGPEFRVCTNNVSTYTSNCNNSDNYKNPTSTYNIVSSGVTTPIHSACVSPGQSLQTNMQVPVLTNQPISTSVQASQPQSLTQVQLPNQHNNINQNCLPHSSLQPHQIQQVIANAGIMQSQLQQTQPVINVMQNQNPSVQPQSIQHINPVDQHVTQTMPQQYQQQIMQHNMPAQFQKSFVPQNQSVLPNCAPIQQSVNQMINQQVPQYYNAPPVQSQNVTSESSTVSMSNQHIGQQQFQSIPIQNQHVQLQQNQQQLPPPVQQMQQQPSPQQNMVQQNQMQSQMVQQNQQLSHQPSISQPSQPQQTQSVPQQSQQMAQQHIQQPQQTPQPQQTHVQQVSSSQQQQQQQQAPQQMHQVGQQLQGPQGTQIQQQLPQQTHHITQLTQMTNQPQQMPQSNQMQQIAQQGQQISQQPQQITLQTQQIPQQPQLQHPKQMQTTQIQPQTQQIPQQQQISQQQQQISQSQMIHQNNQQINHTGQMIPQQTLNQGQQLNQQVQQQQQQQQQQQPQQQIQQQLTQTSQPSQPTSQQIQSMPQQNQILTQQLGINQPNSQMSVSQSQNQQVIQPQHMQQAGQQYQQPQQMMQSQPQQLPMQNNQPIMHQPTYSQAQSLNSGQLQQVVMQIPTNTVTSTQMHIQQQQPVVQPNMMQQPQITVMPQIQPAIPMSQQQMTYSLQQHVPINPNYVNSMQNCYIPSQQHMAPYKPSMNTVETVNKQIEDNNAEDVDNGTINGATTSVAIDNKIEQAMDLVKSHLMYAVREEVEVLKEKIAELMDKVGLLETENSNLRMLVPPDIMEQYNREKQKPTNGQSTHN